MQVFVDSWAWIEYFFGTKKGKKASEYIDDKTVYKITSKINIFEVYYKILKEKGIEQATKFTEFILRTATVYELDLDIVKLAAEIKKEKGMGMADAIVLATAIKNNASVLTGDEDFKGLKETEIIFIS